MARVYSAVFPLDKRKTIEDLVGVCSSWISQSPHNDITLQNLRNLRNDNFELVVGDTAVNVLCADGDKSQTFALKYVKRESEDYWRSELVGRKDEGSFYASFTLDFESQKIGRSKKERTFPRIVRDLVEKVGGGYDGESLRVKSAPFYFDENDIHFVAEILNNDSGNSLPVIYLSRSTGESLALDERTLAHYVSGLAHVLVEPEKAFSFKLSKNIDFRRHTYNGFVGIYWPDGSFTKISPGENEIGWKICDAVTDRSSTLLIPDNLSYEGIRRARAINDILKLKGELSSKTGLTQEERKKIEDNVLNNVIGELESRDVEIRDLKSKLYVMHRGNSLGSGNNFESGVLKPVEFRELYDGESKEVIVDALETHLRNLPQGRVRDYVSRLILANPSSGKPVELREEIKRIFRSCSGRLGRKEIDELEALGFNVQREKGNHLKIYASGSERCVTLPTSPSDFRAANNAALEVIRHLL